MPFTKMKPQMQHFLFSIIITIIKAMSALPQALFNDNASLMMYSLMHSEEFLDRSVNHSIIII